LAEPTRLGGAVRLGLPADLGAVLRALLASAELDTGTLACLAGRWQDGEVVIGWQPALVTDRTADLDAPGCWIGWLDHRGRSWFGRFDTLLRRDPTGTWWLTGDPGLVPALGRLDCSPAPAEVRLTGVTATAPAAHLAAVENAVSAIRAGQLYQVNVCARVTGEVSGPPAELFLRGVAELAPDYAAFLQLPGRSVVSLSPELFLHRRGDAVRTAPIKGTRRRTGTAPDDPGAVELGRSVKDRAENVMIVDLMRNDLARACRPGTVSTGELLAVRPAPGVWHLVSEVTGRLRPGTGTAELLAATFPPGSVTGAPKVRACALIDELETADRGLFTGAIGLVAGEVAEFSVAIRTFEIAGGRFELGVGGGITADSVPMAEWQECAVKAAPLLALGAAGWPWPDEPDAESIDTDEGIFDTMLCRDGSLIGLADHLARLEASCLELYRTGLPPELAGDLVALGRRLPGRHRVRVSLRPGAAPVIETAPAPAAGGRVALFRAPRPAGCWRHKWADRRWLPAAEPGTSPLFSTPDGGVAESGIANLVVIPAAGLVRTPELSGAVLPGVTRRRFLDAALDHGWRVELGRVGFDELRTAGLVLALSSLGELVLVDRLDGVGLEVDHGLLGAVAGWLG